MTPSAYKILLRFLAVQLCLTTIVPGQDLVADIPEADRILGTLVTGHPRLLIDAKRIEELRALVKDDDVARRIYETIEQNAEKILKQKPVEYDLRDGRRLIYVSKDVLLRVRRLSFVYLITGEKRYADRVWSELESASRFKDWNPDHFLDTAIMTKAFAIGLDWLWDEWTPDQRRTLQRAIVEKGLEPAMSAYTGKRAWWVDTGINWNQICNGGIGMGALAVAEAEPELAGKILHHAVKNIPKAMKPYAPDGAGHEGVGYWNFGSSYNVMLMASLETALGTDFGLSQVEGFCQSGDYQIYMSGTNRYAFDFGDCGRTRTSTPQHLWMGRKYEIPRYTWFRHNALNEGQGGNVWDLLWFDRRADSFSPESMPTDKYFRKVEVASMRDSWVDGDGFIVAMQGGYNGASHRHLDLGSFILELEGVRWVVDLGKESETYQRHKNKTARNDFYRVRAEGHNTLVINPTGAPDQNPQGRAEFTSFVTEESKASATLDLTDAYKKTVNKLTRCFQLQRGESLTVTDTVHCKSPSEVWSFFHTGAEVMLSNDKRTAYMKQQNKILRMRLGLPGEAVFEILPASPLPGSPDPSMQASNKKFRKVAIHLKEVEDAVISVRFDLWNDLTEGEK